MRRPARTRPWAPCPTRQSCSAPATGSSTAARGALLCADTKSAPRSPPARPGARPRRPPAAPGPTATRSSPRAPPPAARRRTAQGPAHPGAVSRAHPPTADLATGQIDPLSRDLCPMLVYAHHDRHRDNLPSSKPRAGSNPQTQRMLVSVAVPSVEQPGRADSNRARHTHHEGPATFTIRGGLTCRPDRNPDITSFVLARPSRPRCRGWLCSRLWVASESAPELGSAASAWSVDLPNVLRRKWKRLTSS